jgi:putative copper export protein
MTLLVYTVLTWIGLASLAFSLAVLLFRLPDFAPPAMPQLQADRIFSPRIWRLFGIALALIALSSAGDLIARSTEMSGTTFSAVFSVLPVVLLRTHYGAVWLGRIACLILLFIVMAIKRLRDAPQGRYLMLLATGVLAWTGSASGHAADSGDLTLKELMDLVHFLAISAWGGGVIVLAFVVLPFLKRHADLVTVAAVTRRFSQVAGYAVVFVLVTAIYNMRVYVGEFSNLWTTTYGLTVLAKMLILYFLLLIGALNRYLSLPLLEHAAGGRFVGRGIATLIIDRILAQARGHIPGFVITVFRRIMLVEAVLMLAAILCASLLKHQTPPSHLNSPRHERHLETKPDDALIINAAQPPRTTVDEIRRALGLVIGGLNPEL